MEPGRSAIRAGPGRHRSGSEKEVVRVERVDVLAELHGDLPDEVDFGGDRFIFNIFSKK
jgi:hypothetical protein